MKKNEHCESSLALCSSSDVQSCTPLKQAAKTPSHLRLNLYPNRRLYARGWASYVTVSDLIPHVQAGGTIEVRCSRSRTIVTEKVLRQVLAALAAQSEAPADALYASIRGKAGA